MQLNNLVILWRSCKKTKYHGTNVFQYSHRKVASESYCFLSGHELLGNLVCIVHAPNEKEVTNVLSHKLIAIILDNVGIKSNHTKLFFIMYFIMSTREAR
jgi:hypothetical protein